MIGTSYDNLTAWGNELRGEGEKNGNLNTAIARRKDIFTQQLTILVQAAAPPKVSRRGRESFMRRILREERNRNAAKWGAV
jgi:hypothetical protein